MQTIRIAGHELVAPGFTADSFDRAVKRAHDDGLAVRPGGARNEVWVTNPTNGRSYLVTRHSCSCAAGRRGGACKHRGLAIFLNDIMHDLPQPQRTEVAS